ncbi:MAG: ATP-binding cassette domain-containing protein [Hyphomicrobiales bacterium]|nr:ATP-binding cassette domain-containing protein [Hyphomicrobiales bacterium]
MAPLLTLQDIHLTFGGEPLFEGADLSVSHGERLCLVGRNGSGKSTLLRLAAGEIEPDQGERFLQPGTTIRTLAQEPDLSGHDTVLDYVAAGLAPGDDPHRARYLLQQLGIGGDERPDTLSGGEARRAALARVLAPEPDILLLDEPTNHLDLPAITWLEGELARLPSALVLISHDRRFLETLSRATVWVDRGRTRRLDRGFADFEAWRDATLEQEERDHHKLGRKIVREEHWLRYGVTARRKRNQKRLRDLEALRRQRRERKGPAARVKLAAVESEASGKRVLEATALAKSYGALAVVKDLSLRVHRGDRIGILGPNGAGKTTLVNLLTGALVPDGGTVTLGANLEMVTLDQRREALDPDETLKDALTGGGSDMVVVDGKPRHVVSYMKDFLFLPEQAGSPLRVLSGGERGRLMLARALAKPSNLLVLDEPTNDLDLETLDLLQELLADYSGTVLLVSHDRDFIDRVATSTLVAEGDGHWQDYAGGYSDMLRQRGSEDRPKPVKKEATAPASSGRENRQRKNAGNKLSYKDKYALETLPETIEALQRDIAALQQRLAAPDFYAENPEGFEAAAADLSAKQAELAQAEDQWLELELKREEAQEGG